MGEIPLNSAEYPLISGIFATDYSAWQVDIPDHWNRLGTGFGSSSLASFTLRLDSAESFFFGHEFLIGSVSTSA